MRETNTSKHRQAPSYKFGNKSATNLTKLKNAHCKVSKGKHMEQEKRLDQETYLDFDLCESDLPNFGRSVDEDDQDDTQIEYVYEESEEGPQEYVQTQDFHTQKKKIRDTMEEDLAMQNEIHEEEDAVLHQSPKRQVRKAKYIKPGMSHQQFNPL